MLVGCQRHASAGLPLGNDPVIIVQKAGWAPGSVWRGAECLAPPPLGVDPRTVQFLASRYTKYTIPAHNLIATSIISPSRKIHRFKFLNFRNGKRF